MIAWCDVDTIIYAAAWACEKKNQPLEPVQNLFSNISKQISFIEDTVKADVFNPYITKPNDPTNFRKSIATFYEYKGNRKNKPKPQYFNDGYRYMQMRYNAIEVVGEEADDRVAINHMSYYTTDPTSSCIVAIDKDLNNIPGLHFNYFKGTYTNITESEAMRNFYTQLLTGDVNDNIKGIPKIGPKTAAKILGSTEDPLEMYSRVHDTYKKHFPDDYLARIKEYGQLLWIRRNEGEIWSLPCYDLSD